MKMGGRQLSPIFTGNIMNVIVYSSDSCPWCDRAKDLLKSQDIAFTEVNVKASPENFEQFQRATNGAKTVPQIVIDGENLGGYDVLHALHRGGQLNQFIRK